MRTWKIRVRGIVQGVGFRPFVYRLCTEMELDGHVRNLGSEVEIVVKATCDELEELIRRLKEEHPPLARVREVHAEETEEDVGPGFRIVESEESEDVELQIPPDAPVCEECLEEIFDPKSRRYLYPFTGCTNCGPRFTIIEGIPYDRENTTMVDFPLCEECRREFEDPEDRRYHAQVVCCPRCGPRYRLLDADGEVVEGEELEAIREACELIEEGKIVAIKGIGGFHLACKTTEDEPVAKLRERLGRPQQPFAVMSGSLDDVRTFAEVDGTAEDLLTGPVRPIVVLPKKEPFPLSELVAPGLHTVGVMLPYTGLHHIMFERFLDEPAIVMTSANPPGEPMAIRNSDALRHLRGIADYYLVHDRRIAARCDDSVVRVLDGRPRSLRRSRGYVPEPIELEWAPDDLTVVAVGPELDVTACVLHRGKAYPTQHIGNTSRAQTLDFLQETVERFLRLLRLDWNDVDAVACDLHPSFATTGLARRWAEEHDLELVRVQHHHAHALACLAEHGLDPAEEPAIAAAMDGYGYGDDGSAWGGEILYVDGNEYERIGHLEPVSMPGGDAATYRPLRMTAAHLHAAGWSEEEIREFLLRRLEEWPHALKHGEREVEVILHQIEHPTIETTSAGRFLDAVSAALGVCHERTYEGEPAMKLEAVAVRVDHAPEPDVDVRNGSVRVSSVVARAAETGDLRYALTAHHALIEGFAEVIDEHRDGEPVAITGGVFNNELITRGFRELYGADLLEHHEVPAGDGGVSLGQVVAAVLELR
ncbi:carbamoyltransferase HypF [Methanopyrus kandleri]|uniref:Carbamoyltransferase n=2 Tax=Methanopyrus kandleri TaxID=2320 RepID=Q8TXL4_METKA|nr:carbamoyltransferase HypF [Methanopyrus kandleri]AAM01863.1 Hydrogenase maturation factor [Methanopyrus kandleri AV19]HII70127.1 carbamoyltransferase HypF [Methanopyrus kandleri]